MSAYPPETPECCEDLMDWDEWNEVFTCEECGRKIPADVAEKVEG